MADLYPSLPFTLVISAPSGRVQAELPCGGGGSTRVDFG